jgi:prepilin-type N-terminal cleavage/methylation domain-containing protein
MTIRQSRRDGLTLVEVLLATALLAMALTALAQLQYSGVRAVTSAQLEAEAMLLCQSELDAVLVGVHLSPASSTANNSLLMTEPLASDPTWSRRISLEPTRTPGLMSLTVEILRTKSADRRPWAALTRWFAEQPEAGAKP